MTRQALLLFALLLSQPALGQVIEGTITSAGKAVPLATVLIVHTSLGTAAGIDGSYRLELRAAGTFEVKFSAVGYASQTHEVTVTSGEPVTLDVVLAPSTYEADAIVVTGTLEAAGLRESPVKVDVVPPRFLQMSPSANVMDVLERVNGLYQQIDCGVCYTNNIRINGADGPNTAVLIDGMPIMSSLASVYGLNGISPMLIRQIEVIKGPMSTLYGPEALGGVINILTKNPATAPTLSVNTFATTHTEVAAEFAAVPLRGRTQAIISGTLFVADHFRDRNGDRFSDRPLTTRLSLFAKASRNDQLGFTRGTLATKVYFEQRNAGTKAFLNNPAGLRGSPLIYGESIITRRAELLGSYQLQPQLQLRTSGAFHEQDAFYGTTALYAIQTDAFVQMSWTPLVHSPGGHSPLFGATMRLVRYDDGTGVTGKYDESGRLIANRPEVRAIPGLFAQDDWEVSHRLRLLLGLRGDYHRRHGIIASPRAAVKWQPSDLTTMRLNAGTGFRVVNLFTEDHAVYTGGRALLILDDLRPEQSVSITSSIRRVLDLLSPITIDADVFWTRFSNHIQPDYSVPGQIRYSNLAGTATSRGVSLQVQGTAGTELRYTAGATLLDIFVDTDGTQHALEFAPDYQGIVTFTWDAPLEFVVDYSFNLTGPMALPFFEPGIRQAYEETTGAPLHPVSPAYAVHSIQLSRMLTVGRHLLQIYTATENVLDYRQSSPIVGYYDGNPGFGQSFDTSYVYGPIEGRHFGFGARLTRP